MTKPGRKPISNTGRVFAITNAISSEVSPLKDYMTTSAVPQSQDVAHMDNPVSDRFVSTQFFSQLCFLGKCLR